MHNKRELSPIDLIVFNGTLDLPKETRKSHHVPPKNWTVLHIPKTGGDSIMGDSPLHLPRNSSLKGNGEHSFLKTSNLTHPYMVNLRNPVSHVLSQFLECKYDGAWGQQITKNTGFPGYGELEDVMAGFDDWIQHFHDLESRQDNFSSLSQFNCYNPHNFQTRFFVTEAAGAHLVWNLTDRYPDLELAKSRLKTVDVIGIVEHFPASLCLLEYHAGGGQFLTEDCQVCGTNGKLKVTKTMRKDKHGVPPHSIKDISDETLALIHNMTAIDQQFYEFGLELFLAEVERVHDETGVDLLCGRRPGQAVKTGHLPTPPLRATVGYEWLLFLLLPVAVLYRRLLHRDDDATAS